MLGILVILYAYKAIYNNNFETLKSNLSSYSFTDDETKQALDEIYKTTQYIADPHGAVGYLGCKSYLETNPLRHIVYFWKLLTQPSF